MQGTYSAVYEAWKTSPEEFWRKAAEAIDWLTPFDKVFDEQKGIYGRWFVNGECNTCYNVLDRHILSGRGEQNALVYDSPVTGQKQKFSYHALKDEVCAMAAVLRANGVVKGDRVIIYMPMIPETVIAMLACARIGAIHSVVFGGFAARELAIRIDDAKPRAVISASCGVESERVIAYKPLLDDAIELAAAKPQFCLIKQREILSCELSAGRDIDMSLAMQEQSGVEIDCVPLQATDPLYILYTSGTTGVPKGVVRDNGGHMVALYWTMGNIYDIKPGEVFWAASDVGWVVGHSYIVYAPLLLGATTILFEGKPVGTPDAGAFWRVIEEHKVVSLFTAPTALRAIRKEDPSGALIRQHNLETLRSLFLAGERADPDTIQWAQKQLGIPVIDHWWQTETGWTIAGNPLGIEKMPTVLGSPTVAMPGYDPQVLNDAGAAVKAGELGNIVLKLPLPPGAFPTLWQNDERFKQNYLLAFPGYYQTSDAGYIDENGYVFIMARTDDVINVAGHRLSTGGMEEVITGHPDVAECAVVGIADTLKGQIPAAFLIINSGVNRLAGEIEREVIALVREKIGPVASLKKVMTVPRLPKTRSGKILRGTIRAIADGETITPPATIDDPVILDEIREALSN